MEVYLKNVRVCYAQNLFNPSSFEEGQAKKYSAQFIVPKDDTVQVKAIKAAIEAVAKEKWGAKAANTLQSINGTDFLCLRDGEKKPDREELEGAYYVAASNKKRPTLVNRDRSPIVEDDGVLYSGCYVNARVDVYAYELDKGKKMICATLMGVQFVKDGDAFSGSPKTANAEDFDDLSDVGEDSLV